jgi:hypothetical protein
MKEELGITDRLKYVNKNQFILDMLCTTEKIKDFLK